MVFTNPQPLDSATVPISSEYSPQNNTFPAMQGADGAYVDAYGNASTAPVMSFIQPRVVQRNIAVTGSGAKTLSCTFNYPNIGGNSIVVCLGIGDTEDSVTSFVVTDTQKNTYMRSTGVARGSILSTGIYLATGIKPGQNTITVAIAGPTAVPTGISMKIYEVWGLIASVDALDQAAIGTGTSGLIASTGAFVPAVSNEMAFSAVAVGQVATITPAAGWSANDGTLFPWGGSLGAFDSQYRQLSTITPFSPTANMSLSSSWAMAVATFRSIVVPVQGTFNYAPCFNANLTSVASWNTPVQLLGFFAARRGLTIYNESTATLYMAFGTFVSKSSYTVQIPGGQLVNGLVVNAGFYEMPLPIYPDAISGVWSSVSGFARITELS